MTIPLDTFELFAELSLALAGFSGVAAAFGGRDREFRPIEISRLTAVFLFAGASLVDALLVISLAHAGVPANATYQVACLVAGLLLFAVVCRQYPPVLRLYRAGEATTSGRFLVFSTTFHLTVVVLLAWAGLYERESWPLVVGISAQLMYGLWMFARLLLRAN